MSAALEYSRLRSKLTALIKYMDDKTEENDHVISKDIYNEVLLHVLSEFEGVKCID